MKHRLAVVAAVLGLAVAGCGRDSDTTDTTSPPPADTTVAPDATVAHTAAGEPDDRTGDTTEETAAPASDPLAAACASEPLEATDTGVSASTITIEVMADVGSPLAPGLFQGNLDAVEAFADHVNANGGIGCRQLAVRTWDSKLDPKESLNGQIDACANALAMVGNNTLFNPDVSAQSTCADAAGNPTGIPDLAALVNDPDETCGPTTYSVQPRLESCPIVVGQPRTFHMTTGATAKLLQLHPGLHGLFMVAGVLPTPRQAAVPDIAGQEAVGVTIDASILLAGTDEQAAFTPRVQLLKQQGSNYVYNASNDVAMVKMQKETAAQGIDTGTITWACSLACYTRSMLDTGGPTAEGTYVWMQFLPFEEADTNPAVQAYVDAVGEQNAVSFGAQAWQAAMAFQQAVDGIVVAKGPNAITRAEVLAALDAMTDFDADGWTGPKSLRGTTPCFVLLQIQDGAFVRVWPTQRGTLDCDAGNITDVTVEPVSGSEQLGR